MFISDKKIYFFGLTLSLLLSIIAMMTDDLINADGILYINVAKAFLDNGLTATAELYEWPFYSILTAYFHQISSFNLELSARSINIILFVLLTYSLIQISAKLVSNNRQLLIATLLILSFAILNEYREFLIRDTGYWAFSCLALHRFMVFVQSPQFKHACIWLFYSCVALLFRVEGIAFLLAYPLSLFVIFPFKPAIKLTVTHFVPLLISLAVIVFSVMIFHSDFQAAFGKLNLIVNFIDITPYLAHLKTKTDILGQDVLNQYSADYSTLILLSGLIVMLAYELIMPLCIPLILFAVAKFNAITQTNHQYRSLLIFLTILNCCILVVFILSSYFVSTRYCIMAMMIILLLLIPTISAWIEQLWLNRSRKTLTLISLVLLLSTIASITKSNSKSYIADTAIWAAENLPLGSSVLTNDKFIQYYFDFNQPKAKLTRTELSHYSNYDYLMAVEKRKNTEQKKQIEKMNLESIHVVSDKKNNRASIYRVVKE